MTEEIISRGHPRAHVQGVLWYGVKPGLRSVAPVRRKYIVLLLVRLIRN